MGTKGGRPSKWSLEIAMGIAYGLGQGKCLDVAARDAGIGASTAWRWVQAGRAGDPRFAVLVRFVEASMDAARAEPDSDWDPAEFLAKLGI